MFKIRSPGTSLKTNPVAMEMVYKDTLFTNFAEASDGRFYWEGLEEQVLANASPDLKIKDWQGIHTVHTYKSVLRTVLLLVLRVKNSIVLIL